MTDSTTIEQLKQGSKNWDGYAKALDDNIVRKFTRVSIEAKEVGDENEGFSLPFTISTQDVDRDNDTIDPAGWDLTHFLTNPVVLWAHNGSEPPIAKAPETFIDHSSKRLRSVAEFMSREMNPFSNMIGRMFKGGFLNAASVGFIGRSFRFNEERDGFFPTDFTAQELLEWSGVPIPSNATSLVEARGIGIDTAPLTEWAEKILDGEGMFIVPRAMIELAWEQSKACRVTWHPMTDKQAIELEPSDRVDEVEIRMIPADAPPVPADAPAPAIADVLTMLREVRADIAELKSKSGAGEKPDAGKPVDGDPATDDAGRLPTQDELRSQIREALREKMQAIRSELTSAIGVSQ